jgi:hypothetical protein
VSVKYNSAFDSIVFKEERELHPLPRSEVITYEDICNHFKISLYHAKLYLKKAGIRHIGINGIVDENGKKRRGRRVKCFHQDVFSLLEKEMSK